jgi:hypothetical protein
MHTGCSQTIARASRAGTPTTSTLICVCPADCSLALICLTYDPPQHRPTAPSRNRHTSNTDSYLVACDGTSIAATLISAPLLAHDTPTSAAWLGDREVLVGTAFGEALCVRLRPARSPAPSSSTSTACPKPRQLTVERVLGLQHYASPICGVAVLGAAAAAQDARPRRCVLLASANALFCFPGVGTLCEVLEPFDSASAVQMGLVIELDKGASSFRDFATGYVLWHPPGAVKC